MPNVLVLFNATRRALRRGPGERERYRRWWIESSGLSARELYEIAAGLG